MTTDRSAHDLADIHETDSLIDAIASGRAPADDTVAAVLAEWLAALDVRPSDSDSAEVNLGTTRRARLRTRRAAVGAALAGLVLAGAGTAAALPGTPIHRALFGSRTHTSTTPEGHDPRGAHHASPVYTLPAHASSTPTASSTRVRVPQRPVVPVGPLRSTGDDLRDDADSAPRSEPVTVTETPDPGVDDVSATPRMTPGPSEPDAMPPEGTQDASGDPAPEPSVTASNPAGWATSAATHVEDTPITGATDGG